jgi:hypothetical protein
MGTGFLVTSVADLISPKLGLVAVRGAAGVWMPATPSIGKIRTKLPWRSLKYRPLLWPE